MRKAIIPIISILGGKKTGKTKLVERLIHFFSEMGYQVGYAKHSSHEVSIDKEGKDTWRAAMAGATVIIGATPSQTFTIEKDAIRSLDELKEALVIKKLDLVLLEGFSGFVKDRVDIPKVVVTKDFEELDEWIKSFKGMVLITGTSAKEVAGFPVLSEDDLIEKLKDYVSNTLKLKECYDKLPGFDCGHCGFKDCISFAEAVMKGEKNLDGCEMRYRGLSIKVEDEKLMANTFVQSIIRNAVLGMVSSLKGTDIKGDESVQITIKAPKDQSKK